MIQIDERQYETLHDAIDCYGIDAQIDQAIEECAELIQALLHVRRGRDAGENLAEELADVQLMLWQLMEVTGKYRVRNVVSHKIRGLRKKIDTEYDVR